MRVDLQQSPSRQRAISTALLWPRGDIRDLPLRDGRGVSARVWPLLRGAETLPLLHWAQSLWRAGPYYAGPPRTDGLTPRHGAESRVARALSAGPSRYRQPTHIALGAQSP